MNIESKIPVPTSLPLMHLSVGEVFHIASNPFPGKNIGQWLYIRGPISGPDILITRISDGEHLTYRANTEVILHKAKLIIES